MKPKPGPSWLKVFIGFLTGRGATIEYHFEDMEISVPSSARADASRAKWKLNGALKIKMS